MLLTIVGCFILTLFLLLLYCLPLIVAVSRDHPNASAIAALNLLLGWCLVGWVVAFVWSLTAIERRERYPSPRRS